MKKYLLAILVFMGFSLASVAQMSQNQSVDKTVSLGIKGGVNMPRMLYFQNPALMQLPQSFVFTPTGGLFLDIPITNALSLSPEAVYVQRGTDMTYSHRSGAKVHYSISTSYIDLRLPLELGWTIKPYFEPFFMVGVEAGMCLFGQIHLDRTAPIPFDNTIAVDSANMSMIHAGAFAGVGIRSKLAIGAQDILLKFNVSVHQGFLDSYSPDEKAEMAQAVNVIAYRITGYRLPQGLEVTLGIAIPLKRRLEDACAAFSKDRYRRHGSRGHAFGF